jgi:hypothetical protein
VAAVAAIFPGTGNADSAHLDAPGPGYRAILERFSTPAKATKPAALQIFAPELLSPVRRADSPIEFQGPWEIRVETLRGEPLTDPSDLLSQPIRLFERTTPSGQKLPEPPTPKSHSK